MGRAVRAPALNRVESLLNQCRIDILHGNQLHGSRGVRCRLVQLRAKYLDLIEHGLGAVHDECVASVIDADRERRLAAARSWIDILRRASSTAATEPESPGIRPGFLLWMTVPYMS